ncbi:MULTISPECIES: hypothetical protein [Neobacillus]|jgi:hypothetical protein|uniref:LysM domain-containing protein n=1 Tax=Neobacillus sedimentimangrovi TaxID=2699460 RepID=A0ABS8QMX5_9BACI|nr:hypothetical protein [Neobacillus sedimentimangrovi]AIM15620.1 hypothetical protein HW35_04335 [Bacillus sp. X1(2014)]MCD4840025.1 hypothetical protein [Neobacillus sedimentimangrovi]
MKKLVGLILVILTIYVIFIDLTVGTIPSVSKTTVESTIEDTKEPKSDIPSFQAKVNPGETVITIVEHHLNQPLPIPISDLIKDFQQLNPGIKPEEIQIGSTYHFPDYSK